MDVIDISKRHGKEKKYNLFRVLCCHTGTIDQSNKKNKCYINHDKYWRLVTEMDKELYLKVLERKKNCKGETKMKMIEYS